MTPNRRRLLALLAAFTPVLAACRTSALDATFDPATLPPPPPIASSIPAPAEGAPDAALPSGRTTGPTATGRAADATTKDGMSIEEALLLALANNRDLQVRRLRPLITGAFEAIECGVFDPEFYAEVTTSREQALEVSRSTREEFDVDARETDVAAGVRRHYASGTDVDLGIEHESTDSNRAPKQKRMRVGLTVTQALLRGRGAMVNLASVRQAEIATQVSRYELRGFVETLLADTKIAYWNYVLALEQRKIVESSLEIAKRQLFEIEQSIDVGALPATEAAAARTEVALREQALINIDGLIEERRLRLLKLLGPTGSQGFDRPVVPTTHPEGEPSPLTDVRDRVVLALRSRPDLNEARLRYKESTLETVITRDGLRPRLDFFVSLGKTGYSDDLIASFTELGGNTYDLQAGITFSHKPVDHAAEGRHLAAWAGRQQAALAIHNLEALVRMDVRLAANEVERARRLIAASRTTRELQAQTVEAEKERFAVGSSTAILVAQAQRDLLGTQIAEVEALVNYRIALVRLYLAEGTMLERHGISMP